jgi:hypothetical protein
MRQQRAEEHKLSGLFGRQLELDDEPEPPADFTFSDDVYAGRPPTPEFQDPGPGARWRRELLDDWRRAEELHRERHGERSAAVRSQFLRSLGYNVYNSVIEDDENEYYSDPATAAATDIKAGGTPTLRDLLADARTEAREIKRQLEGFEYSKRVRERQLAAIGDKKNNFESVHRLQNELYMLDRSINEAKTIMQFNESLQRGYSNESLERARIIAEKIRNEIGANLDYAMQPAAFRDTRELNAFRRRYSWLLSNAEADFNGDHDERLSNADAYSLERYFDALKRELAELKGPPVPFNTQEQKRVPFQPIPASMRSAGSQQWESAEREARSTDISENAPFRVNQSSGPDYSKRWWWREDTFSIESDDDDSPPGSTRSLRLQALRFLEGRQEGETAPGEQQRLAALPDSAIRLAEERKRRHSIGVAQRSVYIPQGAGSAGSGAGSGSGSASSAGSAGPAAAVVPREPLAREDPRRTLRRL